MSELDVRTLPPSERHGRIHDAFEELDPGETLTVINDHDPKPLYHELAAEVPAFGGGSPKGGAPTRHLQAVHPKANTSPAGPLEPSATSGAM